MSGEVWTQVYDRSGRAGPRAPHHAGVRQHAPAGRAGGAAFIRDGSAKKTSPRITAAYPRKGASHAEQRLKRGELKVLVATASLELGIDIGDVDLVCQIGSTRSINAFLQRVGRAGHSVGGHLQRPVVSAVARRIGGMRGAAGCGAPRRIGSPGDSGKLARRACAADHRRGRGARMGARTSCSLSCAAPIPTGRCGARNSMSACACWRKASARAAAGARRCCITTPSTKCCALARARGSTALTSGGAIPDNADYKVMLEPEGHLVGTVNEDFAVESLQGDVFPARQYFVPDTARGARHRARRGCARSTALDTVLAGRGAGPHRRNCRRPSRGSGRRSSSASTAPRRG